MNKNKKNKGQDEEQDRAFEGIWISAEIWLSAELTMQEKLFLVEIKSLDNKKGCFASNQYFSEFFGISKVRVSEVISSLIFKGFLKSTISKSDGNERTLRVVKEKMQALKDSFDTLENKTLRGSQTKVKEGIKETFTSDNNISNSKDNNTSSSSAIAPQTASSPSKKENSFNWNLVKGNLTAEQADAAVRDLLSDPPTREKIFQTAMWNGSEEDLQAFIPKFCSRAIEQYGKKIQSKYSLITELEIWLGKEKHFASSETHRFNAEQFKSHYEAYVSKIEKLSPQAKQELLNKREVWSKYIELQFIPKLNEYKFLSTYDGLNTQDFAYIAVKYNKGPHFKIVLECIAQIADTKKYVSFRRLREAIDKAFEDATKQK